MADELRQKVRESGFYLSDISSILLGLSLVPDPPGVDGDPPKLEAMARDWSRRIANNKSEKDKFRKLWDRYQRAYSKSVDYLRSRFQFMTSPTCRRSTCWPPSPSSSITTLASPAQTKGRSFANGFGQLASHNGIVVGATIETLPPTPDSLLTLQAAPIGISDSTIWWIQ
jgi:hypothetical protein